MPAKHRLDPLLQPASVALMGASDKTDSPGAVLAAMVHDSDFAGEVYAVNPRCAKILGRPCFPNLESLPVTVEHVIIALGNAQLEAALKAVIAHGAKAATIYSSGVLEQDQEPGLNARLHRLAGNAGLQICGANGMGFYNLSRDLYAGIFPRAPEIIRGNISYIAQSGSAFTTLCHNGCRLGFNLCVSAGNELATTIADYMDWSLEQDETRVIALFVETVRDAPAFVAALEKANHQGIPVVALKIGKSPLGAALAMTHTGAIAGNHAAFEALFRRHGVIEVSDFDEMAAILMLLQSGRKAGPGGFAAAFESGGLRELVTDLAHEIDLEFAVLDDATRDALQPNLDPGLVAENPLDVWGSHDRFEARFEACLEILMQDPNVAGGAFVSNFRDGYYLSEAIYRAVEKVSRTTSKPIALATCYADLANAGICRRAQVAGIPVIDGARETLLAFRRLFAYYRFRRDTLPDIAPIELEQSLVSGWKQKLAEQKSDSLGEVDALALLADFKIPVVEHARISNLAELLAAAAAIGFPLVLKTATPGIDHKSESNGVYVNIRSEQELSKHYTDLCDRLGPTALLSRMVAAGVEIGLGTVNDAQFGPIVMVAAGGVLVELLADRTVALCPVGPRETEAMLESLKANRLLLGVRGRPAVNRPALIDAIVKLSRLAIEFEDSIAEIDINPVLVNDREALAVDALVLLKKPRNPC